MGLGIPRVDGAGCHLTTSVTTLTSAAVPVETPVDPGIYCVKIFDIGGLTSNVSFKIATSHP
jgi:hypothetical protein